MTVEPPPPVRTAGPGLSAVPEALAQWYERATWHRPPWSAADLVAVKGATRIAVVLPALDEEATVAGVVSAFEPLTRGDHPLVDEIIVMDSGSRDRTAQVAAAAGARVVHRDAVLPHLPARPGKGEVMWRALAATDADLLVYADADLVDVDESLVVALLGPLLTNPAVGFVKAFYDRPLRLASDVHTDGGARTGGGRVTELLARPAVAVLAPELGGIIQPLGGEYAARRSILEQVPFASGYAVEIGLLLDVVDAFGLDCVAQVDVGVRKHRHRDLLSLGETATEILLAIMARRGGHEAGRGAALVQFDHVAGGSWSPRTRRIEVEDRPPMLSVTAAPGPPDVGPSRP